MVFLKAAKQYKKIVKVNLCGTSSSWPPLSSADNLSEGFNSWNRAGIIVLDNTL